MLFLKGKFCQLREITEKDLPKLLTWRNKEHVLINMEHQAIISPEEHAKWYQMIRKEGVYYFIIETHLEKPVGTIYFSSITEDQGAECGLYIGEEDYLGTGITLEASKLLIDYAFNIKKLHYLFAKVKKSNAAIISYNESLGFKIAKELSNNFYKMILVNDKL
jgi:RimJ/RimL family protein N-acetyltransferase